MRVVGLSIVVLSTGCLSMPERPGPEDGCHDGQAIHATFDRSPTTDDICAPWGASYGNTIVSDEESTLRFFPRDDMTNSGGCRANGPSPFDDRGVFIEVPTVETAASGRSSMLLEDGGYLLMARGGTLFFKEEFSNDVYGMEPYNANRMRWWRMRPERDANAGQGVVVGEYSANGFDWVELGRTDGPPPQSYELKIEVGVEAVEPMPGFGEFDNLNTCVF